MNIAQRVIVLTGAVAVAILMHTYFCDWRRDVGAYSTLIFPISTVTVDGKEYKELFKDSLRDVEIEIESTSSKISERVLIDKRKELEILRNSIDTDPEYKDSEQYDARFGVYSAHRLRPLIVSSTKQTALIFGVILPIVILMTGVFIAAAGAGRSASLPKDSDASH